MSSALDTLPHEVISDNILCYLDYKSLCNVAQTCKDLRACAYSEQHWKALCKKHWLDVRQSRSQSSWRENFIEWFKDMGRYIDIYPEVKSLWNRIFVSLKRRAPLVYRTLLRKTPVDGEGEVPNEQGGPRIIGASEQDLSELERVLSRPLPEEVRCSYRICNGQNIHQGRLEAQKYGLLGTFAVYHYILCEVFLSVQGIIENLVRQGQNKALAFTSRHIFVPGHSPRGQIGFSRRVCLVDSGELKVGNVCIQLEEDSPSAAIVYAENFTEFLEMVAANLEKPELIVEKDGSILQFSRDPGCEAETYHVRVSVATVLVPEFSQLNRLSPRLMFAYRITMAMDKDEDPQHECTLQARHWDIVEYESETNQRSQTVDGRGVIGEYPRIAPGVSFSYSSWTPMKTQRGHMEGHFVFLSARRENVFNVVCPRFNLRCPDVRNYTFNDCGS